MDFENGVWVHRLVPQESPRSAAVDELKIPQQIWNWSVTAHREVQRIATHRPVDPVEAPVWDCEGIAFLLDRRWPLVTSLQTTLHFWLQSHPGHGADEDWMESFGRPVLMLERMLMQQADGVRAISAAIRSEIEAAYGFRFDPERARTAPLGLAPGTAIEQVAADSLTVLFVGRLEARKGIDTLLQAIPLVLAHERRTVFRIIGDNTLQSPDGGSFEQAFRASADGFRWAEQVRFEGRVDDADLLQAYADCELFVAPSRFESFGLVFLEAMRAGKPVIGCRVGGVPEVVAEENGILVEPGGTSLLPADESVLCLQCLRATRCDLECDSRRGPFALQGEFRRPALYA